MAGVSRSHNQNRYGTRKQLGASLAIAALLHLSTSAGNAGALAEARDFIATSSSAPGTLIQSVT